MNKDKRNNIQLLGTLNNADESGIIANASQVYDANENKSTQDVSKEHTERIETLETKENSMQTTLENISKTGEASAASNVTYNHNDSQLDATNVQQAIDEVRKRSNYNDGDEVIDFNTIHIIKDNPEFIMTAVDADDRILYGIKSDGQLYFGVGCPQQVKDYIDEQINKILGTNDITTTIDSLKEIEAFLKDFTNSDTLKKLLDLKANVDEVRATTDDIYKKSNPNDSEGNVIDTNTIVSVEDNPEYIKTLTDNVGKLIEAIGLDGVRKFFAGINIQGVGQYVTDNPEYIVAWLDSQDRIIFAIENDGNPYFGYGVPKQIKGFAEDLNTAISSKIDELMQTLENLENAKSELEKSISDNKTVVDASIQDVYKKSNINDGSDIINTNEVCYIQENTNFIEVKEDKENKIVESLDNSGKKIFYGDVDIKGELTNNAFRESIGSEVKKNIENEIDKKINLGDTKYPSDVYQIEDNKSDIIYAIITDINKLLMSFTSNGRGKINGGIDISGASLYESKSLDYSLVIVDANTKVLGYIDNSGTFENIIKPLAFASDLAVLQNAISNIKVTLNDGSNVSDILRIEDNVQYCLVITDNNNRVIYAINSDGTNDNINNIETDVANIQNALTDNGINTDGSKKLLWCGDSTSNYVLTPFIKNWCKLNNIELIDEHYGGQQQPEIAAHIGTVGIRLKENVTIPATATDVIIPISTTILKPDNSYADFRGLSGFDTLNPVTIAGIKGNLTATSPGSLAAISWYDSNKNLIRTMSGFEANGNTYTDFAKSKGYYYIRVVINATSQDDVANTKAHIDINGTPIDIISNATIANTTIDNTGTEHNDSNTKNFYATGYIDVSSLFTEDNNTVYIDGTAVFNPTFVRSKDGDEVIVPEGTTIKSKRFAECATADFVVDYYNNIDSSLGSDKPNAIYNQVSRVTSISKNGKYISSLSHFLHHDLTIDGVDEVDKLLLDKFGVHYHDMSKYFRTAALNDIVRYGVLTKEQIANYDYEHVFFNPSEDFANGAISVHENKYGAYLIARKIIEIGASLGYWALGDVSYDTLYNNGNVIV